MANTQYNEFLKLPDEERQAVFESCAERLGSLGSYIEKDFWVCKTLDVIYNNRPKDHPRILFKGGTSLSKIFGAIHRFSEDIDVVLFREDIGFSGEDDLLNTELSNKGRKRLVNALNEKAAQYIGNDLLEILKDALPSCTIERDPDVEDGMTLLVQYPSLYETNADDYVSSRVKIEGGARSALDPHNTYTATPYINDDLSDFNFQISNLITIEAERTLLEKTLILHGWYCGHRDEKRLPNDQNRLSRHYYDVAMLSQTQIADNAIENMTLFKDVIQHTEILFSRKWMKLDEILSNKLHLVPNNDLASQLEKDYSAMEGMILGETPKFGTIMEQLEELEKRMNKS